MLNFTAEQLEAVEACRQAAIRYFTQFKSAEELTDAERALHTEIGICAEQARSAIDASPANGNSL